MDQQNKKGNQPDGGSDRRDPSNKRLSGAARRKLKKLKKGQAEGSIPAVPQQTVRPGSSTGKEAAKGEGGLKRTRSDGSTPGKMQPTKKSRKVTPSVSFKAAVSDVQMAIIPHGYPETILSEDQARLIRESLISALDKIPEGGPSPRFSEVKFRGGILHASCADQSTKEWLGRVVGESELWEGAKLGVIDSKDVPKPMRTLTWIPGPSEEPEKVLKRLKVQNPGLRTETWSVVDKKLDPKGQQLIILMDERSWTKIQELNHRPYLNLTRVLFKALGKGKEKPEAMLVDEKSSTPATVEPSGMEEGAA